MSKWFDKDRTGQWVDKPTFTSQRGAPAYIIGVCVCEKQARTPNLGLLDSINGVSMGFGFVAKQTWGIAQKDKRHTI